MKYNKLVRDKIPERIIKDGELPVTHIAGDKEFWIKLNEKLGEEVNEFLKTGDKEELVDILETIYAICELKGIDKNELERMREFKSGKKGSFKKRIILDEVKKPE